MSNKIYLQRRPEEGPGLCHGCYYLSSSMFGCRCNGGEFIYKQVIPKRLLRTKKPDSLKNTIAIDIINGNDKNSGTIEKPVQTIETACKRMQEQEKIGILFIDSEVYKNIYKDGNV